MQTSSRVTLVILPQQAQTTLGLGLGKATATTLKGGSWLAFKCL